MSAIPSFHIPYGEIKKDKDDFGDDKELGRGGYGTLYLGKWKQVEVAIKELINQAFSKEAEKEFERETQIMRDLRHPNVILLYGICTQPNRCLVMEYCTHGSLYDFVQNKEALEWPQRISWALDIAKGLSYLHSQKILHRDLKSPNILIDKHLIPKITDFGLSQIKLNSKPFSPLRNRIETFAWMAPEVMEVDSNEGVSFKYTPAADVYSYAVIAWELAVWKIPYEGLEEATIMRPVLLEEIPSTIPPFLKNVITGCWKQKPEERLLLADVIKTLNECQKSLSTPSPTITPHLTIPPAPAPSPKIAPSNESIHGVKLRASALLSENSISGIFSTRFRKLPALAFGAAKWGKYFGSVGAEPPLPPDIEQSLSSPCPFWSSLWSRKKVAETHILVLIPHAVNGRPFTLDTLQELVQNPKGGGHATKYSSYWDGARKEIGNKSAPSSYWALMTKNVLPNRRKKTSSEQQALIKEPYDIPGALEIATGILMHYVETGERLYSDYTRCQEVCGGWCVVIGSFGPSGLSIYHGSHIIHSLGGVRKL